MASLMMNWKLVKWIALSLAVVAVCALSWSLGADRIQAKWDAEKAALAEAALKQERKDQAVADAVGAKVAAAAVKERVVYKTLIKEIPKYVESDCDLSGGFRVFHDAAANATVPDPSATGADAAPVKAQDVAATVAENYESCRDNERRLEALQEIIKKYNSQ
jgi:hypothetical protein